VILPLVAASPAQAKGTGAIRCAGRNSGGIDFEALLTQAGRIGSDIAALLGAAMAVVPGSPPLPLSGAAPASTGPAAGAGEGPWPSAVAASPGLVASLTGEAAKPDAVAVDTAPPGVLPSIVADAAPIGAALPDVAPSTAGTASAAGGAIPAVPQHASGGAPDPGAPSVAGAPLLNGAHPGRGRGIGGEHAGRQATERPANAATPAVPATPAGPGVAPAQRAVPAVPSPPAHLPASPAATDGPALAPRPHPRPDAATAPSGTGSLDAAGPASTPAGSVANIGSGAASTAHADAPVAAAALPARIAELARRRSGGTEQVVVRLDPPELGSVRISLTARGDQVHVVVRADTPEARAALDSQRGQVEQLLRGEGFDLNSFDVGHQRREHEQHPHRTASQTRFGPDLSDLSDAPAPAADGALRL
jgi:flagellar hook-length control protein FliK